MILRFYGFLAEGLLRAISATADYQILWSVEATG